MVGAIDSAGGISPAARLLGNFILGGMALAGSILVAYGWSTYKGEETWALVIFSVGVSLLTIVAVGLVGGQSARVNVALTAVSLGASIYLANAWLFFTDEPPQGRLSAAAAADPSFDLRTIPDVVEDLRRTGAEAYPRAPIHYLIGLPGVEPYLERLLPLGGLSRVTTVLCNESGTYVTFGADRYGFNNDDTAYDSKDGIKALVVGDSFAQGMCVPQGEETAGLLRSRGINAVTVGNLANGPLLELATLIEYGRAWQPPVVFWLYYANDLDDLAQERKSARLRAYLKGTRQNLIERQAEVDSLLKSIFDAEIFKRGEDAEEETVRQGVEAMRSPAVRLREFITLYHLRKLINLDRQILLPQTDETMSLFEKIVRAADDEVRGWGGRLYFVYLADWQSFAQRPIGSRNAVLQSVEDAGIPILDFETIMRESDDPLAYFPYRAPNHYTSEGYNLLVDKLMEFVYGPESERS
ncbi:MAG: hypothetical protein IH626_03345 [Rhodospirillales bacterium]|nr:hypothetical protein [Rhodospirillales bacterium]